MSDEAILVDRIADPINFSCVELAMNKGTIVQLSGARGVKATDSTDDVVIGITGREKIVADGRLSVPVFLEGIFRCKVAVGATIPIGTPVAMSGANLIKELTTDDDEDGFILGRALEAGTSGGTCEVLLGHGGH